MSEGNENTKSVGSIHEVEVLTWKVEGIHQKPSRKSVNSIDFIKDPIGKINTARELRVSASTAKFGLKEQQTKDGDGTRCWRRKNTKRQEKIRQSRIETSDRKNR